MCCACNTHFATFPRRPLQNNNLKLHTLGPFIREKIRRVLDKTRTARINGTKEAFASYFRRVLAKTRLILEQNFRLFLFVPFIRAIRVLSKTRLIFSRINGPIYFFDSDFQKTAVWLYFSVFTSTVYQSYRTSSTLNNLNKMG